MTQEEFNTKLADKFKSFSEWLIMLTYSNRRTAYLAKHGKNRRIRKKNFDKVMRWWNE